MEWIKELAYGSAGRSSINRKKKLYKFRPCKISKIKPYETNLPGAECPKPRSGHRIVVYKGDVYAFGGYTPVEREQAIEHVLFKELWKFNCASRTWQLLETTGKVPDTLASHCAVLYKNQMLVYGGTGIPFGETSSNDTYACNLDTLEWGHLETTGTPPLEQYGQAMAVYENKMYVIGGTTGFAYSMYVHCLDLATKEWKLLGNYRYLETEPAPRYRHEIAIYDNKIFVFGGGTANTSFDLKEIPVFNLKTNIWSKVQTPTESPVARRCHGCVQLGSDVFICGGLGENNNGGDHSSAAVYSDIWKIDLKNMQWTKLPTSLPSAVYFHSAAASRAGQMFVFGGVNSDATRTNEIYSMWLKVPSLADICWQGVLTYIPHLPQRDHKTLYEAGIPYHFLKEVDFQTNTSGFGLHCCNRLNS